MKQFYPLLLVLLFKVVMPANGQLHWESLVLESDEFTYLVPESEPASQWIQLQFDDSNWFRGNGGFGYGDGDDNTIVPATTSLYLRKQINIPSSVNISQLLLDIDYDDAFVAYINGVEVARSANLLDGTPSFAGSVTYDHEARMYSGGLPERFRLNPDLLINGENLLAVHILNISLNSSDLSSRIFLQGELDTDYTVFNQTPSWFTEPVSFSSSNLPIVKIDTDGKIIPDEPKITATMKVIDNFSGENSFFDTSYTYNGFIGIEIRGNTSQMFPKKSYSVETRLSSGENNNVPLMRMPVENDWVFHGPYSDKSLIRNALAYNIGNAMGRGWHPRTRFMELEINGEYLGVYLLVEKIKIDNDRVDIARVLAADTTGDELTGGYIISIDRDQFGSWNSPFMGRTGSVDVPFSYVDPKYRELLPVQREYIKNHIIEFETALHGNNYKDPELGYRKYIDVISFIDYFIITELSKDLDGYRVSVFFHKDKDSKGGKLTMTPFWDYNICFGNANFFHAGNPVGWASDGIGSGDAYEIPFWWDKFRTDPYFESLLKYRWQELRKDVISIGRIRNVIDSITDHLSEAQIRNFHAYDILNSYVWPNNYIGGTYNNEVAYLKEWLEQRINWLDLQIAEIEGREFGVPSVSTAAATNITNSSAIIGGFVSDDGGCDIHERGLYFGTLPEPRKDGLKIKLEGDTGNYYIHLTSLRPSMLHYVQAYAINDLGEGYGKVVSFSTLTGNALPAVATLNATGITDHSATVAGSVIDDGGAIITERGFFWGTTPSPESTGSKIIVNTLEDQFSQELISLTPMTTYYVRAYAVNELGLSLGADHSFTTGQNSVGITEELNQPLTAIAYPNPFSASLTIGVNIPHDADVRVVITNMFGQIISDRSNNCIKGYNQFIFRDTESFGTGQIYFFTVHINGIPGYKGKVVKQ